MNIYESGAGDALINPSVHTHSIRAYLDAERAFILRCLSTCDALVEAGCSSGRYAAAALNSGKQYLGIDRVARYILQGKLQYPLATFVTADIIRLADLLPQYLTHSRAPLVVVPFNLIGTLTSPEMFLTRLFAAGHHFLLFSFNADATATAARADYYATSGFHDLQQRTEADGVLFTSATGLHSFAYTANWFEELFMQAGITLHKAAIGSIGTVYSNF